MIVTHLNSSRARALGLFVSMSVAFLYGCNSAVEQPQGGQQPSPQAPAAAPAVPPAVSVNAVMVGLVDHASHELWNVEQPGRAPKTDADWQELDHHAIQLAASGTLLALGGTGNSDPGWAQAPNWKKYSQALNDAGLAALKAVQSKNQEALVTANGQLVETCESCHKEFKPDLPSEGIAHPHLEPKGK